MSAPRQVSDRGRTESGSPADPGVPPYPMCWSHAHPPQSRPTHPLRLDRSGLLRLRRRHLRRPGRDRRALEPRRHSRGTVRRVARVRRPRPDRFRGHQTGDAPRTPRHRCLPPRRPRARDLQGAHGFLVIPGRRCREGGRSPDLLGLHVCGRGLVHLPGLPALRPQDDRLSPAAGHGARGRGVRELLDPPRFSGHARLDRSRPPDRDVRYLGPLHGRSSPLPDAARARLHPHRHGTVGR